jgi:transcriptional regulator with XRE-family HTH domain
MSPVRERDAAALSLFADETKAAREQRGWSQADLADQIPYSLSTISMVEALRRVPTRDLASHLDKAFGTPGTFTRLEGRLRDLPFPASFRPFAAYETEATALYVFEHSLVPGSCRLRTTPGRCWPPGRTPPMTRSTIWSRRGWPGRPS